MRLIITNDEGIVFSNLELRFKAENQSGADITAGVVERAVINGLEELDVIECDSCAALVETSDTITTEDFDVNCSKCQEEL